MKTQIFLISLLFAFTFAQDYTLPDLGLDNTAATCANAQSLITRTNEDIARLQGLVNSNIPAAISVLNQVDGLVAHACSIFASHQSPASFLELQAKSTPLSKGRSGAAQKLASAQETVESMKENLQDQSSFIDRLVNDRLDGIHAMMAQVREKSGDNQAICSEIDSSIADVVGYLNWLSGKLTTDYIQGSLPQRIADIQAVITQCEAEQASGDTYVQAGSYWQTYVPLLSLLTYSIPSTRTDDIVIKFDKTFSEVPSVAVALRGFDLDDSVVSIFLSVVDVKKNQFTVRVTATNGAKVYGVHISYLATITSKSGLYIYTNSIDKDTDQDLRNMYRNNGEKRIVKHIPQPSDANQQPPFALISGFAFGPGYTPRLEVKIEGNSIAYRSWGDTQLYGAAISVIYTRHTGSTIASRRIYDIAPASNSPLYTSNYGTRGDSVLQPKSPFAKTPQIFLGLTYFEFKKGYNYRLKQDDDVTGNNLKFSLQTWSDTRPVSLKSRAFVICTAPGASNCLTGN